MSMDKIIDAGNQVKKAETGFIFDEKYTLHVPLQGDEIESPSRLKAIVRKIKGSGNLQNLVNLSPSPSVFPEKWIEEVHPPLHVRKVEETANNIEICRFAVSGTLTAVDAVCSGNLKNAFCAVRPPGHHAFDAGVFGFCYFNNAAIAAKYAQKKYKLEKVMIIDWDYHHGNGTQDAFYRDPTVFYFSTHKLDAFPVTGFPERKGEGDGYGYNLNVPMNSGADDEDFIEAFENNLIPAAESFRPNFILISAGFDSRKNDLLGDFEISDDGFYTLTKMVMELADKYCSSKLVSIMEGGYNPKGLASAVEAHLNALAGK